MKKIVVHTDGACSGNPGDGGYGAILEFTDRTGQLHRRELSEGYRDTTNNRMELLAVIAALEALQEPCAVEVYSDSSYVIKGITEWLPGWVRAGWRTAAKKPVKNQDLWQRFMKAAQPHQIQLHWVKGHADNPGNNRADELAVAARLKSDLLADRIEGV